MNSGLQPRPPNHLRRQKPTRGKVKASPVEDDDAMVWGAEPFVVDRPGFFHCDRLPTTIVRSDKGQHLCRMPFIRWPQIASYFEGASDAASRRSPPQGPPAAAAFYGFSRDGSRATSPVAASAAQLRDEVSEALRLVYPITGRPRSGRFSPNGGFYVDSQLDRECVVRPVIAHAEDAARTEAAAQRRSSGIAAGMDDGSDTGSLAAESLEAGSDDVMDVSPIPLEEDNNGVRVLNHSSSPPPTPRRRGRRAFQNVEMEVWLDLFAVAPSHEVIGSGRSTQSTRTWLKRVATSGNALVSGTAAKLIATFYRLWVDDRTVVDVRIQLGCARSPAVVQDAIKRSLRASLTDTGTGGGPQRKSDRWVVCSLRGGHRLERYIYRFCTRQLRARQPLTALQPGLFEPEGPGSARLPTPSAMLSAMSRDPAAPRRPSTSFNSTSSLSRPLSPAPFPPSASRSPISSAPLRPASAPHQPRPPRSSMSSRRPSCSPPPATPTPSEDSFRSALQHLRRFRETDSTAELWSRLRQSQTLSGLKPAVTTPRTVVTPRHSRSLFAEPHRTARTGQLPPSTSRPCVARAKLCTASKAGQADDPVAPASDHATTTSAAPPKEDSMVFHDEATAEDSEFDGTSVDLRSFELPRGPSSWEVFDDAPPS